ncbi:MAG: hypothetical protein OXI37_03890 [Gammaproteobacteria bacterium]|nr:hypothetical protein [Gammaproteobacteria bacterium]
MGKSGTSLLTPATRLETGVRKPKQAGYGFQDDMPGRAPILGRIERFCP